MKHDRAMNACGEIKLPAENNLLQFSWDSVSNAIQTNFADDGSWMLIKELFELILPVYCQSLHIPRVHTKPWNNDERQRLLRKRCRLLPIVGVGPT